MPEAKEILELVRRAGVVGAGGGGFPTAVKLSARVEMVIANGAECEPLARVDQQRLAAEPGQLLRGLELALTATGARTGVVALKKKYTAAREALEAELRAKKLPVRVHLLEDFYPAGDEFVLVREITGRIIPEMGLPLSVGVVVNNVSTLMDVAAAVDEKQPVSHRWVTVAGAVKSPATFRVPVGTEFRWLVQAAGGPACARPTLVVGGPMMGSLTTPEAPVTKTTSLLLVLDEQHPVVRRRTRRVTEHLHQVRAACLKCMLCTEICPRSLLGHRLYPDRLMRALAAGVAEDLAAFRGAFLCSECGLCAVYACVMGLDPCAANRLLKERLSRAGVARPEPAALRERAFASLRRVPSKRLLARLGVSEYDRPAPLREFSLRPRTLLFPLKQHAGLPAEPLVKVGERLTAGTLLAEPPPGKLGAPIHTGLSGRVAEVTAAAIRLEVTE